MTEADQTHESVFTGRAWTFGDSVPNDGGITTIETTRRGMFDPVELGPYCMTEIDPDFPKKAGPGDIIVGGAMFGTGQLHVQGPLGIRGLGLGVICSAMTRGFFHLSVAAGLRMLPYCGEEIIGSISSGDRLNVDFTTGRIENLTRGQVHQTDPLPPFLLDVIDAGGERAWLARKRKSA